MSARLCLARLAPPRAAEAQTWWPVWTWPAIVVLGAQLALAAPAHAQAQVEFIPSASLFTVFDDNLFADTDGSAGRMLLLRPGAEASYESPTVRLLGFYSFDMQRSNFSTLNTFDARRHAYGESAYRVTPFTTLGVTGQYDRSETPGEIDADIGLLGERRTAARLELAPTVTTRIGPRTALSGGYDWVTEHLIDGERGTMNVGRAAWSRDMSARTVITGSYVGRYFVDHVEQFSNYQSHALVAEWARLLAPGTRLALAAGPKLRQRRGIGVEASATYTRTIPRAQLTFDYWHGETILLGVTGPVDVDSATGLMSWPLSPRFALSTYLGASNATTLAHRSAMIYRGSVVCTWTPPDGLYSVSASYDADFQDGSIRNPVFLDGELAFFDQRVLRHVFRVSVTVAPRYRRSILPPEEAARAKGVTR